MLKNIGYILGAAEFAARAHGDQKRKYTGEPYIVHPLHVAQILTSVGVEDTSMICAAILHDVLEDTPVTYEELAREFGHHTALLVQELTNVSKLTDGNRAERKKMDRERLAQCTDDAATIKLADLISNTASIVQHDPNFAVVYMAEKEALLGVLRHGDSNLYQQAERQIAQYKTDLGNRRGLQLAG